MPALIPHVYLNDAASAIELYRRAFGAEELQRIPMPDGKKIMHCHLRINGSDLFVMDGQKPVVPDGFLLHLAVDNVDAWWKRATDAGLEVKLPLAKQPWGATYGQLRDRFGITWSISTQQ